MTKKARWITSVIVAADQTTHAMPWERGARRAQMIARRRALLAPAQPYARSA